MNLTATTMAVGAAATASGPRGVVLVMAGDGGVAAIRMAGTRAAVAVRRPYPVVPMAAAVALMVGAGTISR